MKRSLPLSSMLLLSVMAAGCVDAAGAAEAPQGAEVADVVDGSAVSSVEQLATDPNFRIYNVIEAVLPVGNWDGVAGKECVALLNPEYRLRKIILVEAASGGGACVLSSYSAGQALSFTWGDTVGYGSNSGAIAALRTALNDTDGAVHRLDGTLTNETAAMNALRVFLTQTDAQQASLGAFPATRVHSIYDFEGEEEEHAEAAYQGVRVTQPCEQPGDPRLDARTFAGFVYGYTASNSGSCHSGWFSKWRVYNRNWRLVAQSDYSE